MSNPVRCGVCGQNVFTGKGGGVLIHTRALPPKFNRFGIAVPNCEVCPGSTRGARP